MFYFESWDLGPSFKVELAGSSLEVGVGPYLQIVEDASSSLKVGARTYMKS